MRINICFIQGLKLRRIQHTTDSPFACSDAAPRHSWPTPGLACRLIDIDSRDASKAPPIDLRMSFFECNSSLTSGYSVAISWFHIVGIHAHHSGASARFYSDLDASSGSLLWMYMPINTDEYVTEIWTVRYLQSGFAGLMVRCADHVSGHTLTRCLSVLYKSRTSDHVRKLCYTTLAAVSPNFRTTK